MCRALIRTTEIYFEDFGADFFDKFCRCGKVLDVGVYISVSIGCALKTADDDLAWFCIIDGICHIFLPKVWIS